MGTRPGRPVAYKSSDDDHDGATPAPRKPSRNRRNSKPISTAATNNRLYCRALKTSWASTICTLIALRILPPQRAMADRQQSQDDPVRTLTGHSLHSFLSSRLIRNTARRTARSSSLVSVLPVLTSSPIRNCHFQMPGLRLVRPYSPHPCKSWEFSVRDTSRDSINLGENRICICSKLIIFQIRPLLNSK
jgi:hypothetical protein